MWTISLNKLNNTYITSSLTKVFMLYWTGITNWRTSVFAPNAKCEWFKGRFSSADLFFNIYSWKHISSWIWVISLILRRFPRQSVTSDPTAYKKSDLKPDWVLAVWQESSKRDRFEQLGLLLMCAYDYTQWLLELNYVSWLYSQYIWLNDWRKLKKTIVMPICFDMLSLEWIILLRRSSWLCYCRNFTLSETYD